MPPYRYISAGNSSECSHKSAGFDLGFGQFGLFRRIDDLKHVYSDFAGVFDTAGIGQQSQLFAKFNDIFRRSN